MWRLVRKFSFMFLVYQGIFYAFLVPLVYFKGLSDLDPPEPAVVFMLQTYIFLIILGSVWSSEQLEHKTNGYAFLQILPVRAYQIVGAKFLLTFLAVAVYVMVHLIWICFEFDDPRFIDAARDNIILAAGICLALAGPYYLGFYRFGYQRFSKTAIAIWLLTVIAPLPTMIVLKERFHLSIREIMEILQRVDLVAVGVGGAVLFLASMWGAVRLKETRADVM